jgi:hypothetical protein
VESTDGPGRLGLVTSELELAMIQAGEAFHASPFGKSLRRFHPGHRAGGPEESITDPLVIV